MLAELQRIPFFYDYLSGGIYVREIVTVFCSLQHEEIFLKSWFNGKKSVYLQRN